MVVIADTSPLNYLILIGQADLLPQLYGPIAIPRAVLLELQDPRAPASFALWIAHRPPWLVVSEATLVRRDFDTSTLSEELDAGEREAILLAIKQQPDVLLLVDDNFSREFLFSPHVIKQRELDLRELEIAAREREVMAKESELRRSRWLNPTMIGLLAATLGLLSTLAVARANNENNQEIERFRAQSNLVLQAIQTGTPDTACKNLEFIVQAGFIDDHNQAIRKSCVSAPKGHPSLPPTDLINQPQFIEWLRKTAGLSATSSGIR